MDSQTKRYKKINRWRVRSKTHKDRLYLVEQIADDIFRCDCPSFRACWHIARIKKLLKDKKL